MARVQTTVIGGGIVGVATAWELARRGEDVTLLEARESLALEASFANGGLLTAAMSDPWNTPGALFGMLKSVIGGDGSIGVRSSILPTLCRWGARFLRHSSAPHRRAAILANLSLARSSLERTRAAMHELGMDVPKTGTLKILRDAAAARTAMEIAGTMASAGLRYQRLTPDQAVRLLPPLADIRGQLLGAIHFPEDDSGDAHRFACALGASLSASGSSIRTGVRVQNLVTTAGAIQALATDRGEIPAQRVIVAAANHSNALLTPLDIALPIQPVKGHSLTIPVDGIDTIPQIPVIDRTLHGAVIPIGPALRVVGGAEFAGLDPSVSASRVSGLKQLFSSIFPSLAQRIDWNRALPWSGLRPLSADGLPYIGATGIRGVFVNTGHGHLGWTQAMGSAALLADLILERPTAIDPEPYRVGR